MPVSTVDARKFTTIYFIGLIDVQNGRFIRQNNLATSGQQHFLCEGFRVVGRLPFSFRVLLIRVKKKKTRR